MSHKEGDKDMKGLHYKFISCVVATLILLSPSATAALSQQPPIGVSGGLTDVQSLTGYTYNYQLLKQTVALWADGRGDVILERTLQNVDIDNWASTTWYFDWYPGNYSQIRAWDDSGPLTYSTSQSGTRIYVTVYFRRLIQPGESYHFSLAITIGNMASVSGNNGRANWYTSPGSSVQEFIQGVTFPSNSTFQSITPTPTTQNLNYLEWRYTNTPPGWVHTIDVSYTMSNAVGVPLLLQIDPAWKNKPYANYPPNDTVNTIGRWGCFMTSAAMIINYWGQRSQTPFQTNPDIFNTWLKNNQGYDAGNLVVHSAIPRYATQNGVSLYYKGAISGRDDSILDDYLSSGNPVIIGVNLKTDPQGRTYPTHYVVATGKTTVSGQPTYSINDPIYGATTLYEKWNNNYSSITLFSGTQADRRSLRISAHSPVELLVTDPLGRKSGYDPVTGIFWNDIPDATYFINTIAADANPDQGLFLESKVLLVNNAIDGQYSISVLGTGQGAYEINAFASDWTGLISRQAFTGTAQVGSVYTQTVNYSSVISLLYLPLIIR